MKIGREEVRGMLGRLQGFMARPIEEISPAEMGNYARYIQVLDPQLGRDPDTRRASFEDAVETEEDWHRYRGLISAAEARFRDQVGERSRYPYKQGGEESLPMNPRRFEELQSNPEVLGLLNALRVKQGNEPMRFRGGIPSAQSRERSVLTQRGR